MSLHDNNPVFALFIAEIDARLAEEAAASPVRPSWHRAWRRLDRDSTPLERLAVYRAVRDAASLPHEAGFHLVAWIFNIILEEDENVWEALRKYDLESKAILRAHGRAEDDLWLPGEAPPEYQEMLHQDRAAADAFYVEKLEAFGEHDMARMFRTDRERFDRLDQAGLAYFTEWRRAYTTDVRHCLEDLTSAVRDSIVPDGPMGQLGRHEELQGTVWKVWIFPKPVECAGGAQDGRKFAPAFTIDLDDLCAVFDSVVTSGSDVLGLSCLEGPHVHVKGVFQGRPIHLYVLARAPAGVKPGLRIDTTRESFELE